jgi:hypothetical protein
MLVSWYLLSTFPFKNYHHNLLALYNESMVYFGCLLMVAFTDYVVDPEQRYEHGYRYLYQFLGPCLVLVNFSVLLFDLIKASVDKARLKRKLSKKKKKIALQLHN